MLTRALPAVGPPCRRIVSRFQLVPQLKCAKISREAKRFLVFLLRPAWNRDSFRLRRKSSVTTLTEALTSSSCETDTLVDDGGESSSDLARRKTVRFDDEPAIFFRKSRITPPKGSPTKSPERPCLVRRFSELSTPTSDDASDGDSQSIYEDCMCDFDRQLVQRLRPKDSRSSFFYETESGTVKFDEQGYGHYCLTKYLDKQRAEMMSPQTITFEHPALLPWPSRNLAPEMPQPLTCVPPSSLQLVISPPRSRFQRLQQCIVDEIENAVAILCIGVIIYTCIFVFFLYRVFTGGLLRSH
ncbi:hypothetical protein F5J12DRAFT_457302 [Pisolithus orientalis]|uniref:uncharacterized protein n=1 Tax=Pisolithus orientalis TaxID=936130 RepID=UPI0022250C48|nr:uncharacterized protein F5J12DRAFT_457302 [Pisolithus orientalis]KAI5992349.1 hypothetical protein F5J12DRAFT_457302 [Pisolithus orientalis]